MKTYEVTITYKYQYTTEIQAETEEEAEQLAHDEPGEAECVGVLDVVTVEIESDTE